MISMALCEQSQIINLAEEARANLHADGGTGRLSVDYKTNYNSKDYTIICGL